MGTFNDTDAKSDEQAEGPSALKEAYSVGQLAKRWGVSVQRIKQLIDAGKIPGTFVIPSAGRFGSALRIPVDSVVQAEQDWLVFPRIDRPRRVSSNDNAASTPSLKFFPELRDQYDSESP